jgi:UDP-glucose 4-epimerase
MCAKKFIVLFNPIQMNKFIVTGGAGFIGSHLVEFLSSNGNTVIIIDDLSSGHLVNVKNLKGEIFIFKCGVADFDFNSIDDVECVFHLAAQASVPYSIDHFVESSTKNLVGTFKVIDFCTKKGIPLVYATSSSVYGNLPLGKEDSDIQLLSPYATDKYCMEMYAKAYYNLKGLSSFGLRFFNVYGPKQDASNPYSGVISIFVDRLIKGEPITVYGGYQTRDFVFVDDVVNCIFKAYKYLLLNKVAKVSNVLTGQSISINHLVKCISGIIEIDPLCIYEELPNGDPEISLGSVDQMENLLEVNSCDFKLIEFGLEKTIDYFKNKE